jgi:hypothetical protein
MVCGWVEPIKVWMHCLKMIKHLVHRILALLRVNLFVQTVTHTHTHTHTYAYSHGIHTVRNVQGPHPYTQRNR